MEQGQVDSHLEWPGNLLTGDTLGTSSASVYRLKFLGTSQMKTLPSSDAEAMMRSLKGFLHRVNCLVLHLGTRPGSARDAPVGVQHGGRVASEQRYLVGELAALVHGNDGKCATTARLPIDRDVLGVDLRGANVSFTPPQCRSVGQIGSRGRDGTFSKLVSQALRLIWRLS